MEGSKARKTGPEDPMGESGVKASTPKNGGRKQFQKLAQRAERQKN